MVRFIYAVKPTVCAAVGSRQSTGRSLSSGLAGVLTGDRQESGQSTDRSLFASPIIAHYSSLMAHWALLVCLVFINRYGYCTAIVLACVHPSVSAPFSQPAEAWAGGGHESGRGQAGVWTRVGSEAGHGTGRRLGRGQAGFLAGDG
jgi:hypothetical protein